MRSAARSSGSGKPRVFLFYVSGHGFGHATRIAALLPALRRQAPGAKIVVRTSAPGWLFTQEDKRAECVHANVDFGLVQRSSVEADLDATLAAHQKVVATWEERIEREAEFIQRLGATLVIADIAPIAFAAARRAGVPAVAVGNFTWDWIFGYYAQRDKRFAPIARCYAEAYSHAALALRLPMHGGFEAFANVEDAPLLVRRRTGRQNVRRLLKLKPSDKRPLVLVTFGGWKTWNLRFERQEDLSGYVFVGFSPKPAGFTGDWMTLKSDGGLAHAGLMAACDAAITKPGYGMISESIAHKTRLLYLPRHDFPEIAPLLQGLKRWGCGAPIAQDALERGAWAAHLGGLFKRPAQWGGVALNGEEKIAARLCELAR